MENILANLEVRELSGYNCYAIMHAHNSAIIWDSNYSWKTKEQAEFELQLWKDLPFKYNQASTNFVKAIQEIKILQDKVSKRNLLVKDLRKQIGELKKVIQGYKNEETIRGAKF